MRLQSEEARSKGGPPGQMKEVGVLVVLGVILSAVLLLALPVHGDSCCVGTVGDANCSGGDIPTIGDVAYMITITFIIVTHPEYCCFPEADINQSEGCNTGEGQLLTIGDISILIDYLFVSLPYDSLSNPGGVRLPECLQCPTGSL